MDKMQIWSHRTKLPPSNATGLLFCARNFHRTLAVIAARRYRRRPCQRRPTISPVTPRTRTPRVISRTTGPGTKSRNSTDFVHNSPCAPLAAGLLGAPSINLVMDNWFLREAGSTSRPPFHQDLSYFDFEGTMCVLWLPLEPVTKENGIAFVKGSHLWDKLFMRVRFADGHPSYEPTEVARLTYHPPPDVNADPGAYDLLQWDMELGDCIFFDMRTLHGGLSSVTPTETVRRFTLRMTAPDGIIRYRGDWAKDERAQFEAAGYREGDRIDGPFFPRLWP